MPYRLVPAVLMFSLAFTAPAAGVAQMEVGDGTYTAGQGHNVDGIVTGRLTWAGALAADISSWDVPDAVPFCLQSGPIAPTVPVSQHGLVEDPPLAYLLWRYQHVDTPESRAALAFLVHFRHDIGTATVSAADRRQQWAQAIMGRPEFASVAQLATTYLSEGTTAAGPYTLGPLTWQVAADERSAAVTGLGLQTEAGAWLAGQELTATLAGPARWQDGTTTLTTLTGTEPISLPVRLTGAGTVTLSVTVSTPPVALATGNIGARTQAVAAVHRTGSVSGVVTADVAPQFTPTITSDVAQPVLTNGAALVDVLHIDGEPDWPAHVELQVAVSAYGPFNTPPTGDRPANMAPIATTTTTVSGPASVSVDLGTVTEPGFYTVVADVVAAEQSEVARRHLVGDVTTEFGDPAETALVPWTPVIDTFATVTGALTSDEVVISGLPTELFEGDAHWAADEAEITQTLYGPFETAPGPDDCTEDLAVWQTTLPASNGVHTVTSPDGLQPGWYTWTSELAGSDRISGVQTICGISTETVEVLPGIVEPMMLLEEFPPPAIPEPELEPTPELDAMENPVLVIVETPIPEQAETPVPAVQPELAETGSDLALIRLGVAAFILAAAALIARAALRGPCDQDQRG